jgi:outer membrane lipoprotein carrier protein
MFSQYQLITVDGQIRKSRPASGHFVFSRPGKFIWTYEKPYEQILQADGVKLYIYDKDLNQVTIRKLGESLGANPAAILFGSVNIEKHFTLKALDAKEGLDWLEVIPKSPSSFEKITIGLRNAILDSMELHDAFGQTTILHFSQIEKNPTIRSRQFKFVIPKGADVMGQ